MPDSVPARELHRGKRQFRRRGLAKVAVELALATTAFTLTRLWRTKPDRDGIR